MMGDLTRLRQQIRRAFMMSYLRRTAIERSKIAPALYKCSLCPTTMPKDHIFIDHVDPVVPPEVGFTDWNTFIVRLFCSVENLQALCSVCHKEKTDKENALRKLYGTGSYGKRHHDNISKALRGKNKTLARRLAMSKERKGKPQTPARTRVLERVWLNSLKSVKATNIKTGVSTIFNSVTEAAKELKIQSCNITRVCNGRQGRKQAGGYYFIYAKK